MHVTYVAVIFKMFGLNESQGLKMSTKHARTRLLQSTQFKGSFFYVVVTPLVRERVPSSLQRVRLN